MTTSDYGPGWQFTGWISGMVDRDTADQILDGISEIVARHTDSFVFSLGPARETTPAPDLHDVP